MSRKFDAIQRRLGEKLKRARLATGRRVPDIADELGVARTYWYLAEQGKVSLRAYEKLAKAVGMRLHLEADLVPPRGSK